MKAATNFGPQGARAGSSLLSVLAVAALGACQSSGSGVMQHLPVTTQAMEASATILTQEMEEGGGSMDSAGAVQVPVAGVITAAGQEMEEGGGSMDSAGAVKGPDSEEDLQQKLDDAIEAKVKAEQKRGYADVELEMAKLGRDSSEIEAADSLRAKREALKVAQAEMARFDSREAPLAVRQADLGLERSRDRLLKAETDLANMREIMSEEAEAKNKGEIIRRYEKTFEFAQESLAIEEAKRGLKVEAELPAKMSKLANAVRSAEASLQAKELSVEKGRRSSELGVRKAKHALDQAKRDVKKANKAVAKLRKKLGKGPKESK